MVIKELIEKNENDLMSLRKEHKVKVMFGFGSSVSGNFDFENGDIDLPVIIDEPDPVEKGDKQISLWDKLELFFYRKVNLLSNQVIRNPFLKQSMENSKVLIYCTSS